MFDYTVYKLGKRNFILLLFDAFCFACVATIIFIVSTLTENNLPKISNNLNYYYCSLLFMSLMLLSRFIFKTYSLVWRYTSTESYFRLITADIVAVSLDIFISIIFDIYLGLLYCLILTSMNCIVAILARVVYRMIYKNKKKVNIINKISVAIVGAGQLGAYLVNELKDNQKSHYNPLCFFDIDNSKINKIMCGVKIYNCEDAQKVIINLGIKEIIIAIGHLNNEKINQIHNYYSKLGCKIKIYDAPIIDGDLQVDNGKKVIRDFEIEDLLLRKPIDLQNKECVRFYKNKVVLVTGGGGSIGSEICRQLIKIGVSHLIIVDIYENNAYDIQQEINRKYGNKVKLNVEIGSVRDIPRLENIFSKYNPNIVFHAAAHKHVPLMETSGLEAIKNNVLGTFNVANMSEKYKAQKFILISTDKAVNPTNIMGASKRLCEMVIQCRTDSQTTFAAVRFGNVLGSNGSVIPLFKSEIAAGGPITITDKRIVRYFMTIPEASQLVIQAGAMANKGELFVLDMGKPVRIYDLAYNMIKLSGFEPNKDIEIKEIGLRPGEKLYEELLIKNENLSKTENDLIFIEKDKPMTRDEINNKLDYLKEEIKKCEDNKNYSNVKDIITKVVPSYCNADLINKNALDSDEMKNIKESNICN